MKRVVVGGGTGYIGSALVKRLVARGDEVTVLTRGETAAGNPRRVSWNPYEPGEWGKTFEGVDAVVHLAGERAVGVRFTEANKRRIYDSRILTTRNVVAAIAAATVKPRVLVSMSAVGYYGDVPSSRRVDESSPPGDDFLARLCVDWEAASERARDHGVRVVNPRMGIVFGPGDSPLAAMALPFKLFVGGKIGTGEQGISWVHIDDAISALLLCIDDETMPSKVNVCSPNPASNAEISKEIAKALHRPSLFTVPAFGMKALFGEGAQPILTGQYVEPEVLRHRELDFKQPDLTKAIELSLGPS
jgi:uncharacterized protein